jgi:UDP-glucose 4-epimerase
VQTEIDLRTTSTRLEAACEGAHAVIHLAGPNEVAAAKDPEGSLTDALQAAARVAEAATAAGVTRLVYLSTVHVYGAAIVEGATLSEETAPMPRAAYGIARLACEHLLATLASSTDVIALRMTNAVGAPADPTVERWSLVANDLARQAALTGALRLETHGMQWRDFLPLDDVCRILAGAAGPAGPPAGTYNLASGTPSTVRQVATLIQDSVERRTSERPTLHAPDPPAVLPRSYRVATDRLRGAGWQAEGSLEAAVDQIVEFCLERQEQLTR